jgi:hypothetical protein
MNIAHTIIPRSDQTNSDDLIAGPRTITITGVKAGSTPEQPVSIHYDNDNGRPYKPCKSMRRVLICLWGDESSAYVGKRLTLYRDPNVKFGGDETGGIRISHASGISEPVALALTVTRGKRKPYHVLPLKDEPKQTSAVETIDTAALLDVGETKAREGTAALAAWWESIGKAARTQLGGKRVNDWKLIAQDADEAKKAAK